MYRRACGLSRVARGVRNTKPMPPTRPSPTPTNPQEEIEGDLSKSGRKDEL